MSYTNAYTVNYTDSTKVPNGFVVNPYTTNGPSSPTSTTLDSNAVSANSSLLIYGKGMPNYGERTAENILNVMEHFANAAAPNYAIEGQVWYKNDTSELKININPAVPPAATSVSGDWVAIILANGVSAMAASLDMGTNTIINVVDPSNPQDAATMNYVDTEITNLDSVYLRLDTTNDPLSNDLDMGTHQIHNVVDPTSAQDAATMAWVNSVLPTLDGVVSGATFTYPTLSLQLDHTPALPDVTVDIAGTLEWPASNIAFLPYGNIASANVQAAIQELDDEKAPISNPTFTGTTVAMGSGVSLLLDHQPVGSSEAANKQYVDDQIISLQSSLASTLAVTINRSVDSTTANGVTTTFTTPLYYVGMNKLMTFVNGIKNYADQISYQLIEVKAGRLNPLTTPTYLNNDSTQYYFDITIDGSGPTSYYVVGSAVQTYGDLITELNLVLTGATVNAYDEDQFIFTTDTSGSSGSILVADAGSPSLFSSLQGPDPFIQAVSTSSNYFEIPGDYTSYYVASQQFDVTGSTGNDGTYTTLSSSYSAGTGNTTIYVASVTDATPDGQLVAPTAIIKSSVSGATYGYAEVGTYGSPSTQITFATAPSSGAVLEYNAFS